MGVGKTERPMVTAYAPAPKGRANTLGLGSTVSKYPVFTRGRVATLSADSGSKESDMALELRAKGGGCTGASGPRGSRAAMVSDRVFPRALGTKGLGPLACRMGMDVKPMLMEVGVDMNHFLILLLVHVTFDIYTSIRHTKTILLFLYSRSA